MHAKYGRIAPNGSTVRVVDAIRREWLDRTHERNAAMGLPRYADKSALILLASVWVAEHGKAERQTTNERSHVSSIGERSGSRSGGKTGATIAADGRKRTER